MVQDANSNQMTDSEIINLLSEYEFKEKEMSSILKELKSRDFEYVINFIEQRKQKPEVMAKEQNEKLIKQAKELNEQNMREAEIQRRYKNMLLDKIKANRIEQKKKEEAEMTSSSTAPVSVKVDGYIKIRAVCNNSDELYIGLPKDSSVDDMYESIKTKINCKNLIIKRFGHDKTIEKSSEKIEDVFSAKSIMIDVEYTN